MVYSGDLKSPVARHAGSSPASGTIVKHTISHSQRPTGA